MEYENVSNALKSVAKKYEDKKYHTFEINVGEMALDASKVIDELLLKCAELERLARIGKATEKAFDNGFTVTLGGYGPVDKEFCFSEHLVKWAESEGE